MKKLTKEEKIKAVVRTIKAIKSRDEIFICNSLLREQIFCSNDVLHFYPELKKYKPKDLERGKRCWFPVTKQGRASRLSILNALLKELKER